MTRCKPFCALVPFGVRVRLRFGLSFVQAGAEGLLAVSGGEGRPPPPLACVGRRVPSFKYLSRALFSFLQLGGGL